MGGHQLIGNLAAAVEGATELEDSRRWESRV
jgi:hypothetical protein